jgi:Protein of unknown function (DUF2442)
MSSSVAEANPLARDVAVSADELTVSLVDGRRISVPLAWYPRLLEASPEQRARWEILGNGVGIRWPDLDEDLSTAGILLGTRVTKPKR